MRFPPQKAKLMTRRLSFTPKFIFSQCSSLSVSYYNKSSIYGLDGLNSKCLLLNSFGGWKVQDQGAHRSGVWWGSASWFADSHFSVYPHVAKRQSGEWAGEAGERKKESALHISSKGTNPIMRAPLLWPHYLPEASPPDTAILES